MIEPNKSLYNKIEDLYGKSMMEYLQTHNYLYYLKDKCFVKHFVDGPLKSAIIKVTKSLDGKYVVSCFWIGPNKVVVSNSFTDRNFQYALEKVLDLL